MKKIFLIVTAGLIFSISANAQVKRDVNPSQKVQSDSSHRFKKGKMQDQLNLTKDQKAQMKELHESNKQQRDAIKNDASLSPDQKKQKMKELHTSQSAKMNSILTPDQQAKRNAFMKKMKHNKKMHHKGEGKRQKKNSTQQVQQS